MRSNKIKGSSAIETFIVIILFISFLVLGVVIASSVFHFSLLPTGIVSTGTGNPVPCSVNITNLSTASKPNVFHVSVSDGAVGLVYKVYMNNIIASDPGKIELVGNYSVGTSSFSKTFTPVDLSTNTVIIGNTSGSNVSVDGIVYKAGGKCEDEIFGS
jgi:hypothetical protein